MRFLVAVLLMSVVSVTGQSASAAEVKLRFSDVVSAAGLEITVPPEWDGIWSYTDSMYTCEGELSNVFTGFDTLCAGQMIDTDPGGGPENFECTGSVDGTTLQYECTGSEEVFTDCTGNYSITASATRTGETYVAETVVDISYSGTGLGCDQVPASCFRTVTHATRNGPAPSAYCVTPTESSSFGRIKVMYR